jgi:FtsH-binding integral membrane protein
MSRFPQDNPRAYGLDYSAERTGAVASFFNAVYAWMAAGLALTAVIAWWVSTQPQLVASIFRGPVLIVLFIVEIGLVVAISAAVRKISAPVATGLFLLYAAINGLTFAAIFLVYTQASIAGAFIVSAGTFGAVSLYGFVTKRDLSGLRGILFMGLIGLILASVVNVFWANSTLYWVITYAGVLLFIGLTAYDTQKLKQIALQTAADPAMAARMSVYGALVLYLDFINLFIMLLRIMGDRK